MKKILTSLAFLFLATAVSAQLSGTKTIPGDYPTIAAAINSLNNNGVTTPGVVFNVAAGYTETFTFPAAGLITATGTATAPVVFQKSGTGANPVITSASGVGTSDYIICLQGTDYITFNGIDLADDAANTTTTTQAEWGYAIFKNSGIDGSQFVTIKNCTVALKNSNTATYCIYSDNVTPGAVSAQLTVTSAAGTNSNIKIAGNTFMNSFGGIYLKGYSDATPYAYYDQNNEIGTGQGNLFSGISGTTGITYGVNATNQNNIKIDSNSFTGSVSNTIFAISHLGSNNATAEIRNNTISFQHTGATQAIYGIYSAAGGSGTSNTIQISNNSISGCNYPFNSTGAFYGIYYSGGAFNFTCSGNTITNNILGMPGSSAKGNFYAINVQGGNTTTGSTWNVDNNIITGNQRFQITTLPGSSYYINITASGKTLSCSNNLISNNVGYVTTVDPLGSPGTTYLISLSNSATTSNVLKNTLTGNTIGDGNLYGIYRAGSGIANIGQNKLENLKALGPSGILYGLYLGYGSLATTYIYNNFIGDLRAPASRYNPGLVGVYITSVASCSLLNNTIYLDGVCSSTSAAFNVYANSLVPLEQKNNIFINVSVPGTGIKNHIIYRTNSDFTTLPNQNNNNCFYTGNNGTCSIYNDGVYDLYTIEDYKAVMNPRETVSFSELPAFTNTVDHPYDLHINPASATQCESSGSVISTPVAVNTDIDDDPKFPNAGYPNNVSSPATGPDVGADEFAGILHDLIPPVITCTPLLNTSSFSARTLIANISDQSGIPFSGTGMPRVYWRINSTGNWNYTTGTALTGTQVSFTFGSGVALHDTVYYYIVAQDNAPIPNASALPGFGSTITSVNPPASTVPTPPYAYIVIKPISGVIPVGMGKTYATLTDAVNDFNSCELVGPVTFELYDNSYPSETFPIVINPAVGLGISHPLVIRPKAGVTSVVSGSSATGILKINGADYVTIDGSNSGFGDQSLTWENTNSGNNTYAIGVFNNNGTDPATNLTLKNCIVKASSQVTNNTIAVSFDGAGGGYDSAVIDHNQICSARFGIWIKGTAGKST